MDKIPESIQKIVEDYVARLTKQIPVNKVILFGSYVKGNYTRDSDIDIAIFSDYFKDMDGLQAFRILFLSSVGYKADLQPLPFTMEEYSKPDGIVEEIIKTGVEIRVA